ncbi:MAG: HNH endonuclease [Chloroflexota bacterium]|nr:HNH endonuclease [Chloroflexota bacterium]
MYRQDTRNRVRIAQYANHFKERGVFLRDEATFLIDRLREHGIDFEVRWFKVRLLTVELVPQTCWFSNVRDHVSQDTWDFLRHATYRQANFTCEACGGRGERWPVECHEIWHYDDQHHIQVLDGLMALCPSCHEVKHIGLAGVRGYGARAKAHLATVNGWSEAQTEAYLAEVWQTWHERSRYQWTLDLSWLAQYGITVSPKR